MTNLTKVFGLIGQYGVQCSETKELAPSRELIDAIESLKGGGVPEGMQLVPIVPTEAQWGGLARDIVMWMDMNEGGGKTPKALFAHLKRSGRDIPQWLRDEQEMKALDHVPSKGTRAVIIYRAMLSDAPSIPEAQSDIGHVAVQLAGSTAPSVELIEKALKRAYSLGQLYWQQADSEYTSHHKKADETESKFKQLIADTIAAQSNTGAK